jgi:prepilin-type N-terminal cleavage/methylation domain-containing protein
MNCVTRSNKAFTLIELLVVIAVLALLLSISAPSLHRARSMAKALCCKTNLKNLYLAEIMYTDDYNGWLPSVEKTRQLGGHWGFRAAKGYRSKYDRRGIPETFGLNALFDTLGYIPSESKVWICTDLGMKWMAEEYKCTYSFSIAPVLSKEKYVNLNSLKGNPRSPLITDNITYYTPSPVGWYVTKDARPQSIIPPAERRMPHRYLARKRTDEYGNEYIDYDTYMMVAIDGWIGTNGENKERMGLQ